MTYFKMKKEQEKIIAGLGRVEALIGERTYFKGSKGDKEQK